MSPTENGLGFLRARGFLAAGVLAAGVLAAAAAREAVLADAFLDVVAFFLAAGFFSVVFLVATDPRELRRRHCRRVEVGAFRRYSGASESMPASSLRSR